MSIGKFESSLQKLDLDPIAEIKTIGEMQSDYEEYIRKYDICNFNLKNWLPSLGTEARLRALVAGELAIVVADTGTGKTAVLQNMAMAAHPLKVLFFEIELPGSLMFERFISLQERRGGENVEQCYRRGEKLVANKRLEHIYTCTRSQIDILQMEKLINRASEKIGTRPAVVMVDYIGLIGGRGTNRYERLSYIAEHLKIIAKATDTIIITACQIHRKQDDKTGEIHLHDAKDSGSIENSCGLMLGLWRDGDDGEFMNVKVCKCTKGKPGTIVKANFDASVLRIYE